MKPVSVRFQCFGPYRKEMFVDFAELEKKGLFLICGETGAGKTTILDAICYALYGKSSGGLRGDLSVMRCKLAEQTEDTIVEFIFEANKQLYCFSRGLRYGRKNLIDEHNCKIWKDGEFVPIFENPGLKNVNQKAEEIIGLSYDQFRQVIILPQGQFEKLLVSDSAEKEKILVSLFKAEKWQYIADELYERVAEEDKKLKAEYLEINSRLADYDCENIPQLEQLAKEKTVQLTEVSVKSEQAVGNVKEKKQIFEKALLLNEQFQELEKRRDAMLRLEHEKEQMAFLRKRLQKSDEADGLREDYDIYKEAKEKQQQSLAQVRVCEERLQNETEIFTKVKAKKQALEERRPGYENGVRQAHILENARESYVALERKASELKKAKAEYTQIKSACDREQKAYEDAHNKWVTTMEDEKKKIEAYTKAQQIYLSGISGTLAEKLEEGKACPVCGSTSHPSPAVLTGEKITEKELEQTQRVMAAAMKEVSEAAKRRNQAEEQYRLQSDHLKNAEQAYLTSKASYEEAVAGRMEGIENAAQLEEKLKELNAQIAKYEELEVRLQNSVNESSSKVQSAKQMLSQAKEESLSTQENSRKAEEIWKEKLAESSFETTVEFESNIMPLAEKNKEKNRLIAFETNSKAAVSAWKEQMEKLGEEQKPEMMRIKAELERAEAEQKNCEKERILAQQYLERLELLVENLSKRKEKYEAKRIQIDEDLEFANRLRGRSGISLQRYVLGVMLSSITVEANRLLKNVHKGRYQLYRTDAISGSGRKGGLELEVLDTQNNERRSVTTLSGGEKFLVALSLAIGLSTVVQAQGKGMKLGAMFIDEGFGSLDENSIYDALEVLQGIQKASGLVGIISHVELLRQVIPSKIEVKKSSEGSWF